VGNAATNSTDPSGLLDLAVNSVPYIQEKGRPGYLINWDVKVDKDRPEGASQVWIITKTERWSIYREGKGKWQTFPGNAKFETEYKGDFVDIGDRESVRDKSRTYYDPKHNYEWAVYFERVTKTLGYNPDCGAVAEVADVPLSEKQATEHLKEMRNSTKGKFAFAYLYVNEANLGDSEFKLDDVMPKGMEFGVKAVMDFIKGNKLKIPGDINKATGFYLYVPWVAPFLRYEPPKR
jgi:hypothetical protein